MFEYNILNFSVLIIGVPRSGTTSLLYTFKNNLKLYNEPLAEYTPFTYNTDSFKKLIKYKNIAIKTMSNHKPFDYQETELSFYLEIIPYFDYVILLDRKNINKQEESYLRVLKYVQSKTNKNQIKDIKYLYLQKYLLREISENSNIDIVYYEDLYYGNSKSIFEKIGININHIDLDILDIKNKYKENVTFFY